MEGNEPGINDKFSENELLQLIFEHYGYDFTDYSASHIRRRIKGWMIKNRIDTLSEAHSILIENEKMANSLIQQFSINVTEMFRDPEYYVSLRNIVIPLLQTYPFIRIWHAGCSTGEEVYSMAILLHEEGILDRCRLYATDFNEQVLNQAKRGIYSQEQVTSYSGNYKLALGRKKLPIYFQSQYNACIVNQKIKQNIVWANHNLVTDSSFNEFHLIICRNVLIYFNKMLQHKVIELFKDSLIDRGFLCLGSKENINPSLHAQSFFYLDKTNKIYRLG